MWENTSSNAAIGPLPAVHHVAAAAAVVQRSTTINTIATTAVPASSGAGGFPKWAIGVIVGFVLLVILFALSYHFNLLCFRLLHRYRRHRGRGEVRHRHRHRHDRIEIELPPAEVLTAMGRGLGGPGNLNSTEPSGPSPYADPAADVVLYKRTPLSEGGGHHWIPLFARLYNRVHPEQSRGAFVALHELHGEVLMHYEMVSGSSRSSSDAESDAGFGDRSAREGDDDPDSPAFAEEGERGGDASPLPLPQQPQRRRQRRRITVPSSIPQVQSSSITEVSAAASATHAAGHATAVTSAAPSAVWMTAGIPLRSYITAHLTDPLYRSAIQPLRAGAAVAATATATAAVGAAAGASSPPPPPPSSSALDGAETHIHRRATAPPPADGVATIANGYRAPIHMVYPLAQYCDLRQWHLVDRPMASLGAVQVRSLAAIAAAVAARRRGGFFGGDAVSNDTESADFDVPSDLLYGAAQYKKKLVSGVPESQQLEEEVAVAAAMAVVEEEEEEEPAASVDSLPHIRGNRLCANVSDDLTSFEETA